MSKILIVEDDIDINNLLNKILVQEKYEVVSAYSGSEANLLLATQSFDLILLDLMLPGITGEELITKIRKSCDAPVIIISAKPGVEIKIEMLKKGADDFVSKPFNTDEVLARIEANLRRTKGTNNRDLVYKYKNLELDAKSRIAKIKENELNFTSLEFDLLLTLLKHQNQVFTRSQLFNSCWDENYYGTDNTVDVHISRIRNKIAKFDDEEYIDTVRGIGYRIRK